MKLIVDIDEDVRIAISQMGLLRIPNEMQKKVDKAIQHGISLDKFLETKNYSNCSSCEHTEDECKDCYPELGHKNDKLKRDTEAVEKFVKSNFFKKLMESLDKQDKASAEDTEQFLKDIKAKENEK